MKDYICSKLVNASIGGVFTPSAVVCLALEPRIPIAGDNVIDWAADASICQPSAVTVCTKLMLGLLIMRISY